MRLILTALLAGGLSISAAAMAAEKAISEKPIVAQTPATPAKPVAAKPAAAKPAIVKPAAAKPAPGKPVDYGDMRCAFAIRHRDVLDGQIVAWADGFIEGYAKASPDHSRIADDMDDPAVLKAHIRGYCLKHRDKSLDTALMAIIHHPHATATSIPAQHPKSPAQPPVQPAAPAPGPTAAPAK